MQYTKIHRLIKTDIFYSKNSPSVLVYLCFEHNITKPIVNIGKEAFVSNGLLIKQYLVVKTVRIYTHLFLHAIRQDSQTK
jgi:hypothetical protein